MKREQWQKNIKFPHLNWPPSTLLCPGNSTAFPHPLNHAPLATTFATGLYWFLCRRFHCFPVHLIMHLQAAVASLLPVASSSCPVHLLNFPPPLAPTPVTNQSFLSPTGPSPELQSATVKGSRNWQIGVSHLPLCLLRRKGNMRGDTDLHRQLHAWNTNLGVKGKIKQKEAENKIPSLSSLTLFFSQTTQLLLPSPRNSAPSRSFSFLEKASKSRPSS